MNCPSRHLLLIASHLYVNLNSIRIRIGMLTKLFFPAMFPVEGSICRCANDGLRSFKANDRKVDDRPCRPSGSRDRCGSGREATKRIDRHRHRPSRDAFGREPLNKRKLLFPLIEASVLTLKTLVRNSSRMGSHLLSFQRSSTS